MQVKIASGLLLIALIIVSVYAYRTKKKLDTALVELDDFAASVPSEV